MTAKTTPLSEFGIDKKYLAHTPSETLSEHSDLTLRYLYKTIDDKNLEPLIDKLIETIDNKNCELLKKMFIDTVYLHDLGKVNPHFQAKKMENDHFKVYRQETKSSDHSSLSSQMFIDHYLETIGKIKDRGTKEKFKFLLYAFSYHQAKHHGRLASFELYRRDENNPKSYWQYLDKFNIPHFEFYILNKLLFSLLVSSDYYATNDYMANFSVENFGIFSQEDKTELSKKFQDHIAQFQNPIGINVLRNEMFEEAQKNLLLPQNKDKHIFYLEAPTGSGKTITSINLALRLLETHRDLNKLFYIFPFNTLVEQTKTVFDEIFGDSLSIEMINSITPIDVDEKNQEDCETEYKKSYINRLFFHSPAIISTHVTLFNILFGTSKEDNFPLWQLANSVIILDEIQSYNNHLWWYMVEFFDKYASLLNIKIIIMSATLPKLDHFLEEKGNFVSLISKEKRNSLFTDELFKKRVVPDFSLLDEEVSLEKLFDILKAQPKDKKILFEFIKKQSAREF